MKIGSFTIYAQNFTNGISATNSSSLVILLKWCANSSSASFLLVVRQSHETRKHGINQVIIDAGKLYHIIMIMLIFHIRLRIQLLAHLVELFLAFIVTNILFFMLGLIWRLSGWIRRMDFLCGFAALVEHVQFVSKLLFLLLLERLLFRGETAQVVGLLHNLSFSFTFAFSHCIIF